MSTTGIATTTLPNGLVAATDLAPFAPLVNGTVTSAIYYPSRDGWNIAYQTAKRRLTKAVPASKVGAPA